MYTIQVDIGRVGLSARNHLFEHLHGGADYRLTGFGPRIDLAEKFTRIDV
jgi:hypothetical protein